MIINFILYINKDEDFKFKTLSSSCENFTISGNIAYNDNKTSIYITNIQYCGGNDLEEIDIDINYSLKLIRQYYEIIL